MDGEPEALSDTGTNCNLTSVSETLSDRNPVRLDTLEKKAVHLRLVLEKDFKAADLKWSLFVAAAFSFRYESCLRPFPPAFLRNGVKDMDELLNVITDVPALDLVLQQLDNLDNLENISDIIDLLFYVLVRLKEPCLKTVAPESHGAILMAAQSTNAAPKPQFIFQVVHSGKSNAELKWKELSTNHRVLYAYHGNRLEHFYSILNFGLQQHLNKTTLAGSGVRLSAELSVSMPHSHGGFGWGASCIGGHLSCVALCEIVDTPDGINYQRPVSSEESFKALVAGEGGVVSIWLVAGDAHREDEVGDGADVKCESANYVVSNCDLVRVRYLFVYAKQPASMRFPSSNTNRNAGGLREWVARHKLFSILLGYGLLLATIGFASNQPVNYYYKMMLKKLDVALSNVKV